MVNPYAYDKSLLDDLGAVLDDLESALAPSKVQAFKSRLTKLRSRIMSAQEHVLNPRIGRPKKGVRFHVEYTKAGFEPGAVVPRFGFDSEKLPAPRDFDTYEDVAKVLRLAPSTTRQQFANGRGTVKRRVRDFIVVATRIETLSDSE